jgi:predicted GNAT superfamily acetyltransferase
MIDRFERDFYGTMADAINQGDRSDRFTVVWDLRREPGPRIVRGPLVLAVTRGTNGAPVRGEHRTNAVTLIDVPAEYHELRGSDPDVAAAWRDAVSEAAERCLEAGMLGAAFDRERSAYVFAPADAVEDGG